MRYTIGRPVVKMINNVLDQNSEWQPKQVLLCMITVSPITANKAWILTSTHYPFHLVIVCFECDTSGTDGKTETDCWS